MNLTMSYNLLEERSRLCGGDVVLSEIIPGVHDTIR
jgi:hypothetical protein